MSLKILNLEPGHWSAEAIAKWRALGEVDEKTLSQDELFQIIPEYDILLFSVGYKIDRELIDQAKKLKLVVCAATGNEHIDLAYLKEKGITFFSLKGEVELLMKVTSTSELAFGLLLALFRKIPSNFESVKSGVWPRDEFKGHQLSGKTFGILGYGRLGKIAARIAQGFGMKVIAHDPHVKTDEVEMVSAEELYKTSDVVSVHVNLTAETENLVGEKELRTMKKDAVLINTARGQIVDETALLRALEEGWIAGVATDVLVEEPTVGSRFSRPHPLVEYAKTHDNLIITSHIGGMTFEASYVTRDFLTNKAGVFWKVQPSAEG